MSDPAVTWTVPEILRTFHYWKGQLDDLLKLAGECARGKPVANASKEYAKQLRGQRMELRKQEMDAHSTYMARFDEMNALGREWYKATCEEPKQLGAGAINLRQRLDKAESAKDAACAAYKSARTQGEALDHEIENVKLAVTLEDVRKQIAQKRRDIRGLLPEAVQARSHAAVRFDTVDKLLAKHKQALQELTSKKHQMMVMTSEWVRCAAERISFAVDDLIKYRICEFGIGAVSVMIGGAIKHFITGLLDKCIDAIVKLSLTAIAEAAKGLYDAYARRGLIGEPDLNRAINSPEVESALRAQAKVEANRVKIGGFTELGAKLVGNQYVVLADAFFDMLRSDFLHAAWFRAMEHEAAAVKEGERLLQQAEKEYAEAKQAFGELEKGINALGE